MSGMSAAVKFQTNKTSIFLVLMIGFVSFILSAMAPPFTSPDEIDHVKRAYGLLQGTVILESPAGKNSGLQVNEGLVGYINAYYLPLMANRAHKFTASEIASASALRWSDTESYSPAAGTGYYFPLIYTPQALGLGVGKLFDLTVDASYRLARVFSLAAIVTVLIAALLLYEIPALVTAILILPMTLFQMSSASLDGFSNALAVLAISMYLYFLDSKKFHRGLAIAFGVCLFLLISCRVYLLPMLLLPFVIYYLTRQKIFLLVGTAAAVLVVAWLSLAITYTVDNRVSTGAPTSTIILYYVSHPLVFAELIYSTLLAPGNAYNYLMMFLGVLGWLDAPLTPKVYTLLSTFLVLILLFSFSIQDMRREKVPRLILAFCAVASVLMVFFALLVTWNPHPASLIQGIQGRYFLVPVMLLAYSISPRGKLLPLPRGMAVVSLAGLMVYSTYATIKLLLFRYYIYG